jgi:hypothetical protein
MHDHLVRNRQTLSTHCSDAIETCCIPRLLNIAMLRLKDGFTYICNPMNSKFYNYLSLKIDELLNSNIYIVSSPESKKPIIAKFARSDHETGYYYIAETQTYP